MSEKILWIDNDRLYLEPYVEYLQRQLPTYSVDFEGSIFRAEKRIVDSVNDPYELLILDVMIAPTSADEEIAYPEYTTNYGTETGLAFFRRMKPLLTILGAKILVLTQRLDPAIEESFRREGFHSLTFKRKVDLPTVADFAREVGTILARDMNAETTSAKRKKTRQKKTCILFLAADPTDASRLRVTEESREIQEKLQLSAQRKSFVLQQRMSARPADITQALLDFKPNIVHFSGHGTPAGMLCFENQVGETLPIQPDALAALFEQFADKVSCVLLNACYSEIQANAIVKHINYVIGMKREIGDQAAIAFAIGFYQALATNRPVEDAFALGCVQIRLQGIPEHLTPILVRKEKSNVVTFSEGH